MLSGGSLFKPMLQLAAGRALGFVSTFMIPVVLVRVLEPSAFATYKQLFLIYATLYGIAPVGMAECLYYFLSADPARAGRFVANSLLALLASGAVMLIALVAGAPLLARAMGNPELAAHTVTLGLFVALTMVSAVTEIVMITRMRHRLSATTYTLSDALRALCLVIPALIFRDLPAVMAGAVVFALLRVTGTLVYLRRELGSELRPDLHLLRSQVAYAVPFGAAVTLEIVQSSLHQFVVSHRYDALKFAIYAVGCLQIPVVDFIATGASSVLMVKLAESSGREARAERRELWHEAVRKLALLLLPLLALLLVVGRELIVFLFTERFRESVPVFLIFSLGIGLAVLPTDSALRAYRQTGALFGLNVLRLAVVAAAMVPLLGLLGLPGAAVSVVLGGLAFKLAGLVRIARLLEVEARRILPWRDLGRTSGVAMAASAAAWLAKSVAGGHPVARLAAAGIVFGLTYVAGAALIGASQAGAPAQPAV